jgi:hypothetical protein
MTANETSNPQAVYVYGVVPAGVALPVGEAGVGGREVELLEYDGIAAVVSEFPAGDVRVRRRDLLAHLRTLERIFDEVTVAPCPFGTVIASRGEVESAFLAPRRAELRRLLGRLEGHVQMNVKAEYDEEAVLREIVTHDSDVARARERSKALGAAGYYENIRLGELISARLAGLRASDGAEISARLSSFAAESASDATDGSELLVFKGSFLVARDRLEGFDATLDALAASHADRLRVEAIGPLPPTAFATLGPEGDKWG